MYQGRTTDMDAGLDAGALAAREPAADAKTIHIEEMSIGLERSRETLVTPEMIAAFGAVSGDRNPVHFCETYASGTVFGGVVAHGILSASFISAVIGEQLPGHGAVYLSQDLRFRGPVRPGDLVRARCRVVAIDLEKRRITLDCACHVGDRLVLDGQAKVMAPSLPG